MFSPVDGSRVKHTPVAQSLPMLPNTMACTFTAVPQLGGDIVQLAIGDRAVVHPRPNTAPTAPQSCSSGSCGNGLPVSLSIMSL